MKIDFLLIAQKIVLKILLIKKCAYNSSTLFYPVPFNPFVKETYLFDEENGKWFVEGKSRVAT